MNISFTLIQQCRHPSWLHSVVSDTESRTRNIMSFQQLFRLDTCKIGKLLPWPVILLPQINNLLVYIIRRCLTGMLLFWIEASRTNSLVTGSPLLGPDHWLGIDMSLFLNIGANCRSQPQQKLNVGKSTEVEVKICFGLYCCTDHRNMVVTT